MKCAFEYHKWQRFLSISFVELFSLGVFFFFFFKTPPLCSIANPSRSELVLGARKSGVFFMMAREVVSRDGNKKNCVNIYTIATIKGDNAV
jgi:hypothetical protein